ncbi:hypothetical protein BH11ARM2_BH11ARM2_16840 [soil metagenome]
MTALEPTPLPESRGSRLPPPPPVKTTFAGAGDEDDPSERILADQALRLARSVPHVQATELPSLRMHLRHVRDRLDAELTRVRLVEGSQPWLIWLPLTDQFVNPLDAQSLLVATLRVIDYAIEESSQRMRDLFVPQFASELM